MPVLAGWQIQLVQVATVLLLGPLITGDREALFEGDHPVDELLRYAREHGFDLLVAARPRGGRRRRVLLHGVAEALAANVETSLLIVGTPGDG